jgi:ketosteroid isomerase-like protein
MNTIQDFFTIYKRSAWEKDAKSMIDLYDNDVLVFDMWQYGYQAGLKDWSAAIENWLGSLGEERVHVLFEMVDIRVGEELGWASAIVKYEAMMGDNSVLRSMTNRLTLGLIKKEGRWKVLHQHTSAPINDELNAIFDF